MHLSNLVLPLLVAPAVTALHGHSARGLTHQHAVEATAERREKREGIPASAGRSKGMRIVKKKKRSTGQCQVNFDASITTTATSPATTSIAAVPSDTETATASDSTSTTLGVKEDWAKHSTRSTSAPTTVTISSTASTASASSSTSNSSWYKTDEWSGSSFFDNWSFWEWSDPTHGTVDFQSYSDAQSNGLISINSAGRAVMSVDTTEVVTGGRKAIRIHGNKVWTGGMVLMDAYHMPTGCGTWPAWWQNGPDWPQGGEIDILEGVNDFTQNQVSLHTGVECTMPSNLNQNQLATLTTGSYNSYDCSSSNTANQGCGARDETNDDSYGSAFNQNKGGVYALVWAKAGIKVWFFPRSAIPDDITNDSPDPSGWGTPTANFVSDSCSPYEFFYDHFNIFDTTFCGDWAGADGVWNFAGYGGQQQSCAAQTGYSTCSEYVLNTGSAFTEAYWEISYVKYFNSTTEV